MPYRPCIVVAAIVLLLGCVSTALARADAPALPSCGEPKSLQETAQDETRTRSERCAWRDDSLGPGPSRDMTLALYF
jgi:hypothetical protein